MSNSLPPDIVFGRAPYTLTTMIRSQLQFVLLIILLLQFHNSLCDRTYLLCEALVSPHESLWYKLLHYGENSSFLKMTGLNLEAFGSLLDYLFDLDHIANLCRCGRPPLLGPDGLLGLFLFYLGSTMNYKYLCLIFGITPSVCSRAINMMLKRVVTILRDHLFARVWFPDEDNMREFQTWCNYEKLL